MAALFLIILIMLAYLIGSVPTSVWIGRLFYDVDVRKEGSGNAGATNTIRVLGWKAGVPVLVFDIFKGWLAVSMVSWVPEAWIDSQYIDYYKIALALAAVAGHIFPVLAGFRGGKGVATLLGVGIALYGWVVLFPVATFLVILLATGYVSLASVLSALAFPVFVFYFGNPGLPLFVLAILVAVFIPLTHWKNIIRLSKGKENKFRVRKKK
jgi:glycerol-3-phosphate acyltransferase PlsY